MPHQRLIADVALEIDPATGLLAYSEVVLIGPRQATGKTELLLPLMTHRCTAVDDALVRWARQELGLVVPAPGPQRVLYTAQTSDNAREKWRDVHLARLKKSPYYRPKRRFGYRLQRNTEAMIWENGSMWLPGSTTGKTGGTGDTLDLGIIDEAWSRSNNSTELGMRPAMMTRAGVAPGRQLWVCSMIPGLSRARPDQWGYLKNKRRIGRARIEAGARHGTALFDFTAVEGSDPGDRATWYSCMPGLGRTVPERAVAEDFETMSDAGQLVDFCAEYLGWAPVDTVPRWKMIKQRTWDDRYDADSAIAGSHALCVEMSEDRTRAVICTAGRRADGDWHVEVVEPGHRVPVTVQGVDWALNRTVELAEDNDPVTVVIDPRRPASSLIVPLRNRGIDVLTPSQGDSAGACGRFYDRTGEARPAGMGCGHCAGCVAGVDCVGEDDGERLWHIGQAELDRALGHARPFDLGGGAFTFVRKGAGDILELYGVTLAMHGVEVKGDDGDYDLSESVDQSRPCGRCGRYVYLAGQDWHHADDDSPECPAR
jgi:hypothetical protein